MRKIINKILKKVFVVITICIMLFTAQMMSDQSFAKELQITKENLYSKGELICIVYDGIKIGTEFVVYKKDGKEYPAYCVNREKPGVTQEYSYDVVINELYSNNLVWNVIVNGYPFKTPEELGCENDIEAFAATKLAIQDMLYDYDMSKFNICADSGQRVLDAMRSIRQIARNSNDSKINAQIIIKEENENWEVDEIDNKYISKTYYIETSADIENYNVEIVDSKLAKIVNMENEEKNSFNEDEKFKILLPIKQLEDSGEITLKVYSKLKTYPIFYGETTVENTQNYVLTAGAFENADTILKQKYLKNNTKIEIKKIDGETNEPLKNSKFSLLDENKKVILSELVTSDDGIVVIENMLPGTYYIKEIEAPSNYLNYDELIKVDVKLNETATIYVKNYIKEEVEEDNPETNSTIEVGEKEVKQKNEEKPERKLPRTGF